MQGGRDVVERHDLAPVVAEAGELDLARPVVDGRLLVEAEVVEGLLGVREIAREVRVGGAPTRWRRPRPTGR